MGGIFRQSSLLGKALVGAPAVFGSTVDPGGSTLGLYGKNYKTPIDPMAFTGIHGWDVKQAGSSDPVFGPPSAPGAAGTQSSTTDVLYGGDNTKQRLAGAPGTKKSTANVLLGE